MYDEMPEFRKPQITKRIEDLLYHAKSEATSQILGAYSDGFSDGRSRERLALIGRLKEYEQDSIVAKLIAQLLQKEADES